MCPFCRPLIVGAYDGRDCRVLPALTTDCTPVSERQAGRFLVSGRADAGFEGRSLPRGSPPVRDIPAPRPCRTPRSAERTGRRRRGQRLEGYPVADYLLERFSVTGHRRRLVFNPVPALSRDHSSQRTESCGDRCFRDVIITETANARTPARAKAA